MCEIETLHGVFDQVSQTKLRMQKRVVFPPISTLDRRGNFPVLLLTSLITYVQNFISVLL